MLKIRAERRRRGWNQTKLAYISGVNIADISKIETGRIVPYPGHRKRLAKALRIPPDELTLEVGDRHE